MNEQRDQLGGHCAGDSDFDLHLVVGMGGFGGCYKERAAELNDRSDVGGRKRSVTVGILMLV